VSPAASTNLVAEQAKNRRTTVPLIVGLVRLLTGRGLGVDVFILARRSLRYPAADQGADRPTGSDGRPERGTLDGAELTGDCAPL
jgi:hypothetical protein